MVVMVHADKIVGKQIVSAKGEIMGEVDGLEVDSTNWQVTHLHVSLSKDATIELGLKKPMLSKAVINLPTNLVVSVGEVVTLKDSIKNLRDVVKLVKE
jgi:sporulation protein YlmC with PRC-barrel domain